MAPISPPKAPSDADLPERARRYARRALLMIPVNVAIFGVGIALGRSGGAPAALLLTGVAFAQFVFGVRAVYYGLKGRARRATQGPSGLWAPFVGGLAALGAPFGWFFGAFLLLWSGSGGAWGRPLRVRGKQLHPELREGSDWTLGERPDPTGLDAATRRALEALWLHDAQKEHASVPAFSRVSWLLAAVGAPAELVAWAHRAALEEIDHTRLCFALAAGYGGRSRSVEPMPDLLLSELGASGDPLVTLAVESLADGCQLEDFNADVAAACADVCEEPVTRRVLEQIAREERSHADFSWSLLAWTLERGGERVRTAVVDGLARLVDYPRPTAVSAVNRRLVAAADPLALRRHGGLADDEWAAAWEARLDATTQRVNQLLAADRRKAA